MNYGVWGLGKGELANVFDPAFEHMITSTFYFTKVTTADKPKCIVFFLRSSLADDRITTRTWSGADMMCMHETLTSSVQSLKKQGQALEMNKAIILWISAFPVSLKQGLCTLLKSLMKHFWRCCKANTLHSVASGAEPAASLITTR